MQAGGILAYAAGQPITDNTPGTDFDAAASTYGSGLYVFQRTISPESPNVEIKGYYYDDTDNKYYALQELLAPVVPATDYTATLQTKKNLPATALQFDYTYVANATDPYIIATYAGQDNGNTADDIIINIHLDPSYASYWTKGTESTATEAWFYYKTDVEAGTTTEKLVDFVELDENVSNSAYLDFVYDLKINMESVQVTLDENGAETTDAVPAGWIVTPTPNQI